mmetsp:Transcript_29679/g.76708  ORF Transcript_29679/g.76708 Transcript_29679/m.76708 type:complete len:296 (+) Transcript_29679:104-991(+)
MGVCLDSKQYSSCVKRQKIIQTRPTRKLRERNVTTISLLAIQLPSMLPSDATSNPLLYLRAGDLFGRPTNCFAARSTVGTRPGTAANSSDVRYPWSDCEDSSVESLWFNPLGLLSMFMRWRIFVMSGGIASLGMLDSTKLASSCRWCSKTKQFMRAPLDVTRNSSTMPRNFDSSSCSSATSPLPFAAASSLPNTWSSCTFVLASNASCSIAEPASRHIHATISCMQPPKRTAEIKHTDLSSSLKPAGDSTSGTSVKCPMRNARMRRCASRPYPSRMLCPPVAMTQLVVNRIRPRD